MSAEESQGISSRDRGFTLLAPETVVSGGEMLRETQVVVDPRIRRIVKVGPPDDVRDWLDAERKEKGNMVGERVEGGAVLAGLTDAHQHPLDFAFLKLVGTGDVSRMEKADVLRKLGRMAKEKEDPTKPLVLIGLDTTKVKDLTNVDLERIAPNRDVLVFDNSFHAGVISNRMGEKLRILAKQSSQKPAGSFKRDGTFSEGYAIKAIEVAEAAYSIENIEQAIDTQVEGYLTQGITSMHDLLALTNNQFIAALRSRKRWGEKGLEFPVTRFHLRPEQLVEIGKLMPSLERAGLLDQTEFPQIAGIKLLADGSFGSHTAKMSEEYEDHQHGGKSGHGIFYDTVRQMNEGIKLAREHGLSNVAIHAIGDAGIQRSLNVAQKWIEKGRSGEIDPIRFRIEHFELPLPIEKTLRRVKDLGIWVVPQPNFLLDYVYKDRLGDRTRWICPHQEIVNAGIPMMFGTDGEAGMSDSMLYAIYLATHAPEEQQRLSLTQALLASTVTTAQFEGDERGLMKAGHKADIIVANPSLLRKLAEGESDVTYNADKIAELEGTIERVYKGGTQVYSRIQNPR